MLFKKGRTVAEIYFGGLLAALSIRIGKSILYYFNKETDLLVLQIGLSFCAFIGPLFYLFLINKFSRAENFKSSHHWLLIVLALTIVLVGSIYPYRDFPEIWNGVIIYFIYGTWILFSLLSLIVLVKNWKSRANLSVKSDRFYLITIVTAYVLITFTYQAALFTGVFYIWGSLVFTVSFYVLLGRLFMRKVEVLPRLDPIPLQNGENLMQRVTQVIESEKLFLNAQLKLDDLASATEISKHQLSRILNEIYPHGFSQFVKEYRVTEAKQLIENHPEWSLEGIGYEAGFSSRSSFFEAFKKIESMTPAMFRKTLLLETSPE